MTIEELAKLSDEELRVRCAKALGWTKIELYEDNAGPPILHGFTPARVGFNKSCEWEMFVDPDSKHVPNYPADLNAMHEAVMSMEGPEGKDERHQYRGWLKAICGTANDAIDATARQRCIAFIAVKQQPTDEQAGKEVV